MAEIVSTRLDTESKDRLQAEARARCIPLADVLRERLTMRARPCTGAGPVYSAPWKPGHELRAHWESFNGTPIANLRVWYETANGEWRPGRHGINCGVEKLALVAEAVAALLEGETAEELRW